MVVGAIGGRTELLVIGSGPGGYVAALRAADAGIEVTLVDAGPLGGTCLNVGCIPSKTLIETAGARHAALGAAERGLHADVGVDMATLSGHLQSVAGTLRNGVERLLDDAGVQVLAGTAHFARYDRVSIESGDLVSHLEFDNAVIATGARPVPLPGVPFGGHVLDSTGALALERLPERMTIVGGGYIGIELGTAFAKLGVGVTVVEAGPSILPGTPSALRRPVERHLASLGVDVRCGAEVVDAPAGEVILRSGETILADVVVVAIGRRPNGDRCSAEAAGCQIDDDGFVVVDAELRAARSVYAIGDVVRGPALAHRATNDAERLIAHLSGGVHPEPIAIPAVVYSDPEILSVGEDLATAEARGYTTHRFPHGASARARSIGEADGATFVVADADGTIVGVHAVGPHVSELAGEATLAIEMAATLADVSLTVHAHPTMSETIAETALIGLGAPLHVRR